MNILCKIFGHKYRYYFRDANPNKNIRACKHCSNIQEFKGIPALVKGLFTEGWFTLVERTDKGAKEFIKNNPKYN
jgi:hypothetical protein